MANPPPPPGWYPRDHGFRWWDGSAWTSHTQPASIGSVLAEPVLQFVAKAGLLVQGGTSILDQNDRPIGSLVGQRNGAPASVLANELHVADANGQPILLVRDESFGRYRFVVEQPWAGPVGEIVQDNVLGAAKLSLRVGGRRVGLIKREKSRWSDFSVLEESGKKIASVTTTVEQKKYAVPGKYIVTRLQWYGPPDPVAPLVVASAIKVGRVFGAERSD
ncbi:DUF2510 domain-containing protein [Antrihabitans spumae]|uniref:DUF2510 domain-containing protein n=1 Tax=Antrihabitans spumae TaxID=3373370 RepID=A0ABW7K485_9NOCA